MANLYAFAAAVMPISASHIVRDCHCMPYVPHGLTKHLQYKAAVLSQEVSRAGVLARLL